jgi:hypothetical protein
MKSKLLSVLLLSLVLTLAARTAALARNKTLYRQRSDVDITILTNGDFGVRETQELVFTGGTFSWG